MSNHPPQLSLEPALSLKLADEAALHHYLSAIRGLDQAAMSAAQGRLDKLTKPLGSLGRLESLVVQLAGIAGHPDPLTARKVVVIMCADNGICDEGVSSCPQSVTASVTGNFTKGLTGVNVLASQCGAALRIIDIGVKEPVTEPGVIAARVMPGTANFAREPAMTRDQALQGIATGLATMATLKQAGWQLVCTGEMGIGNTSTSTAVSVVLTGQSVESLTGRGAGLSDRALAHKVAVIKAAIDRHRPAAADPIGALAAVGGLDIAGLVGCFLGAAVQRLPIVIDGFISAAAALVAVRIEPRCQDFLFASHGSAEPGASQVLAAMGLRPMLDLGMRLGEGSGAVLAFGLFDAALACYTRMGTFQDAEIEQYLPQDAKPGLSR